MGTPDFALESLKALYEAKYEYNWSSYKYR